MKKSIRLALLVGASFVGLVLAAPALADYTPSLTVEQSSYKFGAPFTADLFIAAQAKDDPSAKLTIFSPAGYGVNLNKAPGTKVGSAVAVATIAKLGGSPLPLSGDVIVGNPADPSIMAASAQCTKSPSNQLVLVLNLALQGQPPTPFPVFVNTVQGVTTFQVCVPHPDISATNPNGVRILLLDATIKGMFTNPSKGTPNPNANGYEWATLFTPYDPATKLPNEAGTIEWRTFVPLGATVTLAKAKAKAGFKLVGRLTLPGVSIGTSAIRLNLYAGKKRNPAPNATSLGTGKRVARTARLPKSGKFSMTRRPVKFKTFFQVRFEGYITSCDAPSPTHKTLPCKGEDIASFTSNQVFATKPPKKKRHK
jgi:hypothetical protein